MLTINKAPVAFTRKTLVAGKNYVVESKGQTVAVFATREAALAKLATTPGASLRVVFIC